MVTNIIQVSVRINDNVTIAIVFIPPFFISRPIPTTRAQRPSAGGVYDYPCAIRML